MIYHPTQKKSKEKEKENINERVTRNNNTKLYFSFQC